MTQFELGEKLGLSQKAISKYVTEKSLPSIDTLERICNILDLDIYSFFNLDKKNCFIHLNKDELDLLSHYRLLEKRNKFIIQELLNALYKK